ncbi:MAG: SDR family oxidoreductase [Proteobacteria bacterium]|nr:SDR family oxidoreductase [Pseudomonadota bacterium]
MADLTNKVAIVSGGATMIGWKTAEALRDAGAKVVLADIAEEAGEEAAEKLGPDVIFQRTDITDDEQIDACIAATVERFGGVDCLVNVACTYLDNGIDSTRDEWLTALNVNLVGGAIFVQKVVAPMRERGGGAIVNFGSISGKRAQLGRMLYAVSKAAIIGMTRNQALNLAPDNIRVNSVSPGWTWSNVIRDVSGDDRAKADLVAGPLHLIGRLVEPDEVGATVAFLCSDDASGLTGTDIAVDGGYTAIGPEQKVDQVSKLME